MYTNMENTTLTIVFFIYHSQRIFSFSVYISTYLPTTRQYLYIQPKSYFYL